MAFHTGKRCLFENRWVIINSYLHTSATFFLFADHPNLITQEQRKGLLEGGLVIRYLTKKIHPSEKKVITDKNWFGQVLQGNGSIFIGAVDLTFSLIKTRWSTLNNRNFFLFHFRQPPFLFSAIANAIRRKTKSDQINCVFTIAPSDNTILFIMFNQPRV